MRGAAKRASLRASRPIASQPIGLETHALATLEYIRGSMETASSFAVPGLAGISMGSIGVVAALCAALAPDASHELAIWFAAAVLAFVCGSACILRQAALAGTTLYRGPARRFVLSLAPSLVAGSILTVFLWRADMAALLAGTWLLLYGCGVLSASTTTARSVGVMGVAFFALGIAALLLPAPWHNALLGAGFGGLHVGFGLFLRISQSRVPRDAS